MIRLARSARDQVVPGLRGLPVTTAQGLRVLQDLASSSAPSTEGSWAHVKCGPDHWSPWEAHDVPSPHWVALPDSSSHLPEATPAGQGAREEWILHPPGQGNKQWVLSSVSLKQSKFLDDSTGAAWHGFLAVKCRAELDQNRCSPHAPWPSLCAGTLTHPTALTPCGDPHSPHGPYSTWRPSLTPQPSLHVETLTHPRALTPHGDPHCMWGPSPSMTLQA